LGCQENIHGILKKTPLPLPWVVKKAFMEYWITRQTHGLIRHRIVISNMSSVINS
jgi:hypothetical protein